jgi:tetratricopeptide (TPR) repeat protein
MTDGDRDTPAQPIGAFDFPAGLLLLPDSADPAIAEARAELLAGRLPQPWPAELEGHRLAHAGALAPASAAFTDDDPIGRYNRYVLDPDCADPVMVRSGLPPELRDLIDIVAYTLGQRSELPEPRPSSAPEVHALADAASASAAVLAGHPETARDLLQQASRRVEGRCVALAAVLRGNAGTIGYEHELDVDMAVTDLTAAVRVLAGSDLHRQTAELHLQLGSIAHERAAAGVGPLRTAMHHYTAALQLVSRDSAPLIWASAQLNLATAYLSSPMTQASDQLRMAVSMQSLRACLSVFTQADHPAQWATATLNLANSLVYTPSTHQGDNLVEAVELYEQVLAMRDRHDDPAGRANQGNALAHLGVFDQAKAKLVEARFLFEEQLDHHSAITVRSLLDEIAKQTPSLDEVDVRTARAAAQLSRMAAPHREGGGSGPAPSPAV